ncbi:MAG: hypothetical protein MK194_17145 [Roseibacillus sp.]|nr:hypothetical protein [Roseibacillus sp.]
MNRQNFITAGIVAGVLFLFTDAGAQQKDRDTMVRDDRSAMQNSAVWIYNDVEKGFEMAKKDGRPLLIVFR